MNLQFEIGKYRDELNNHRKRLRRFNPEQLVILVSKYFRYVDLNIQRARNFPHNELYYLLKLTIKCCEIPYYPYTDPTDKDFIRLIENQKLLDGPQLKIAKESGDPLIMGLKWLAQFSQFPYQEKPTKTDIGRSIFLFEVEHSRKNLNELFVNVTGINIRDFFYGCYIVFTMSLEHLFIDRYPNGYDIVFKKETWDKFWPLVCITFAKFRVACKRYDLHSDLYEMYSAPIIERYPIIELPSSRNIIPWPSFVAQRICYGPYDILKDAYGDEFTKQFGLVFQNYVERLLKILNEKTGQIFYRDRDYENNGKQPDFALTFINCSTIICIEAKANEDKLSLKRDHLIKIMQPIIGQAVCQCHDFWIQCRNGEVNTISSTYKNCIPLIVTFRPFHFANFKFYRENVVKPLQDDRSENSFRHCIDTYQVIDIRSFEHLIRFVTCSGISLYDVLQKKNTEGVEDDWWGFLVNEYKQLKGRDTYSNALDEISKQFERLYQELIERFK